MAITGARIKPAEYLRTIHVATPEAGTTVAQILEPTFWAHVAKQLHISDRIEVIPEDHAFIAELYVLGISDNSAKVVLLQHFDFDIEELANATKEEADAYVMWRGPHAKFGVIRKKDNKVLQDGFITKAEANKWMASNTKAA